MQPSRNLALGIVGAGRPIVRQCGTEGRAAGLCDRASKYQKEWAANEGEVTYARPPKWALRTCALRHAGPSGSKPSRAAKRAQEVGSRLEMKLVRRPWQSALLGQL